MKLDILETEDCGYDHCENEKVILLPFIFILFLKFHFNIVLAFK